MARPHVADTATLQIADMDWQQFRAAEKGWSLNLLALKNRYVTKLHISQCLERGGTQDTIGTLL